MSTNIEIKTAVPHFERIEVKDEYDANELCEIFEKHKRVIVRADMPGCGKNYACEKMKARGHNVLFVCPTNKLVQNYKSGGVTMNKFFSMSVDLDVLMSKFDSSGYDVVVFDELYLDGFKLEGLQGFHGLGAMGSHAGGAVNAKKADT